MKDMVSDMPEGNPSAADVPPAGWQNIGSAPKQGDAILVWGACEMSAHSRPHIGSEEVHIVFWNSRVESWEAYLGDLWVPQPSHWMALPSPPKSEGTEPAC